MPRRGLLAVLLLAPVAVLTIALQIAAVMAAAGAGEAAWGAHRRDAAQLRGGVALLQRAAGVLDHAFALPTTRLLELNPVTLGAVDDLAAATHALAVGSQTLTPLSEAAITALGFDGAAPILANGRIDPARVTLLADPVAQLHTDLERTDAALAQVPADGPLGRPIGAVRNSVAGNVAALTEVTEAATTAMPGLPEALGANGTQRYLVCALNDAELFASGGAPLSAFLIQIDDGRISVPEATSGQLESKLSPNNPPITWDHVGGLPWYTTDGRYPFVNSNFHPDFRTASQDMRRAWAALGYPEVQGVLTIDMGALASVLDWSGGVKTEGFGKVDANNLVRTVLVDAYREFDSTEGRLERHAQNDELTQAVMDHVASPLRVLSALRGALAAIPGRHLQASFDDSDLQDAVADVGATGALQKGDGDLIGVFSQSGPNKLSVFQARTITQDVQLTAGGGAEVQRTVTFTNDVPDGLSGDPATYRGYLALRARLRVAYRIPTSATDLSVGTGSSVPLVSETREGPWPDDRGGAVLWQGQDIPRGETATVTVSYTLPAGTFQPDSYDVRADPQALTIPAELTVTVRPVDGSTLPDTDGWSASHGALTWHGILDQPRHVRIG